MQDCLPHHTLAKRHVSELFQTVFDLWLYGWNCRRCDLEKRASQDIGHKEHGLLYFMSQASFKELIPSKPCSKKRRPAFRKCHVAGICVLLWRPLWASHGEHCSPSAPGTSLQFWWSQINRRSAMFYKALSTTEKTREYGITKINDAIDSRKIQQPAWCIHLSTNDWLGCNL